MVEQVTYELRLFKPRSEDPTESEPLEQLEDPSATFVVTSERGGAWPYLQPPRGRRGRFDPLRRRATSGELTCHVVDAGDDATSLDRFITRFAGDERGRVRFLGLRAQVRISIDGGALTPFWTGRVSFAGVTSNKSIFEFRITDLLDEMDVEIFTEPDPDLAYIVRPTLLPLGGSEEYAGHAGTTLRATATLDDPWLVLFLDEDSPAAATIYTQALHELSPVTGASAPLLQARVSCRFLEGVRTGEVAEYWLLNPQGHGNGTTAGTVDGRVTFVRIAPLEGGAALPTVGDRVELEVLGQGPASDRQPWYTKPVHPITYLRDILLGKLGRRDASGNPIRSFTYNAAALDALELLPIPPQRFCIPRTFKMREYIEKQICLLFHLGYRIDEENRFTAFDVRWPSSLVGVPTITDDHLVHGEGSFRWHTEKSEAIGGVAVTYYVDERIPASDLAGDAPLKIDWTLRRPAATSRSSSVPAVPPSLLIPVPHPRQELFDRFGELTETLLEIDALGLRASDAAGEQQRADVIAWIEEIVDWFRSPYGAGGAIAFLRTTRLDSATIDCWGGDLRIVHVRPMVDPATNRRGGARLMWCIERSESGPVIELMMLDLGEASVALAPSFVDVALGTNPRHSAVLDIALGAGGEPAVVWHAITDTSVAVRPADDDPSWRRIGRLTAAGELALERLPSGKRIWPRARTEPAGGSAAKLPSGWVYPAGAGYLDTTALAAPTGLVAHVDGGAVRIEFTAAEAEYSLQPLLDGEELQDRPLLPPGADAYVFDELAAATEFSFGIRHVDPYGGVGVLASVLATTGASNQLRSIQSLEITQGGNEPWIRNPADRQPPLGIEVEIVPSEPSAGVLYQMSTHPEFLEHNPLGGIWTEELRDGPGVRRRFIWVTGKLTLGRYVRAKHVREGYLDSEDWSPVRFAYGTILYTPGTPSAVLELKINEVPGLTHSDVFVQVRDPLGKPCILEAWTNSGSTDDAVFVDETPEQQYAVESPPENVGPTQMTVLDEVARPMNRRKLIYFRARSADGRVTDVVTHQMHMSLETLADIFGALKANSISNWIQYTAALRPPLNVNLRDDVPLEQRGEDLIVFEKSTRSSWRWSAGAWVSHVDGAAGTYSYFSAILGGSIVAAHFAGDVADFVYAEAEFAVIDSLLVGDLTIRGHLDAVDGTFIGELVAAFGFFSGGMAIPMGESIVFEWVSGGSTGTVAGVSGHLYGVDLWSLMGSLLFDRELDDDAVWATATLSASRIRLDAIEVYIGSVGPVFVDSNGFLKV